MGYIEEPEGVEFTVINKEQSKADRKRDSELIKRSGSLQKSKVSRRRKKVERSMLATNLAKKTESNS